MIKMRGWGVNEEFKSTILRGQKKEEHMEVRTENTVIKVKLIW